MATNNLDINVDIVLWFYQNVYGLFLVDDVNEFKGITEQLIAESKGLV